MRLLDELRLVLKGDPRSDRVVPGHGPSSMTIALVSAVMAFFAVMALALALASGRLADRWASELAQNATVQIVAPEEQMEAQARAALNVLRTTQGVRSVRMIDPEEQRAYLEPWLGADVPLESLPLPLMIEVVAAPGGIDAESLRLRLTAEAPAAIFDDHGAWRQPLVVTAGWLRLFALGAVGLMAVVLAAVLTLAAHAALAAHVQVVQTLRLVGATDLFITRAFVRRLTARCLWGAVAGTALGIGAILLLPSAEVEGFFLVGLGLSGWHWLVPLLVPPFAALVGLLASRAATRATLARTI